MGIMFKKLVKGRRGARERGRKVDYPFLCRSEIPIAIGTAGKKKTICQASA
jgi:hypothetical protein